MVLEGGVISFSFFFSWILRDENEFTSRMKTIKLYFTINCHNLFSSIYEYSAILSIFDRRVIFVQTRSISNWQWCFCRLWSDQTWAEKLEKGQVFCMAALLQRCTSKHRLQSKALLSWIDRLVENTFCPCYAIEDLFMSA